MSLEKYYRELGLKVGATEDEIKTAYRKMAMLHHPDRNPGDNQAETKFKQIQDAYDHLMGKVSSDPVIGPGATTFNDWNRFDDVFNHFFNNGSFQQRQAPRGQNIKTEVVLEFLEAASGCVKTLNIPRRVPCETCKGVGGKTMKKCVACDGDGKMRYVTGFLQVETTCSACRGKGEVVSAICTDCSGRGYNSQQVTIDLSIPAGIEEGFELALRGQGDLGPNGSGDLFASIRIKPHQLFKRNKSDLIITVPISFYQAVLGATIEVPTLEGSCTLVIPKGTKTGTIFRLANMGLIRLGTNEHGDFLIKVNIDTPQDINERYSELLGELNKLDIEHPSHDIEVFMESCKKLQEKN